MAGGYQQQKYPALCNALAKALGDALDFPRDSLQGCLRLYEGVEGGGSWAVFDYCLSVGGCNTASGGICLSPLEISHPGRQGFIHIYANQRGDRYLSLLRSLNLTCIE